jgi:hypothetical protein
VQSASSVERLAYTRGQAAEALGLSRSTFDRRVLPIIETIQMPWGATLIPVDVLERLVVEWRRAARARPAYRKRGRPAALAPETVERILAERASGMSLAQVSAGLNADAIPTAHGGTRWWPSTVRAVLQRVA